MHKGGENKMVILSSPSGAGKTTITKKIQQKYPNFKISVSVTTRPPRSNEVEGIDYFFVSKEKFENYISQSKFYEYAEIFGNYYGTLKDTVDKSLLESNLIFDIDWQGTKQLSSFKKLKPIKIFLVPHNKEALKKRLINRNQNTNEEIEKRFEAFDEDIKHWRDYDYIIINKNLDVCFKQIENIIANNKKSFLN